MKRKKADKLTPTNYRRLIRAINKAYKNGWKPSYWPLEDTKWELNCCLSVGELLWNKGFCNALGRDGWIKLVNRITGSVETYTIEVDGKKLP